MRRPGLLAALALAGAAHAQDPAVRIEAGSNPVEFGKAFALTVVRSWDRDAEPGAFGDDALAPLVVRLVETARRDDGRRVEETRRFEAWAFERDHVRLPGLELRVASALPEGDPGRPELPGEPLPAKPSRLPWPALVLALALLASVSFHARLRRRRAGRASAPETTPDARALEGLRRLREVDPRGRDEVRYFHVEVAALVRAYAGERLAVTAADKTSEELVGATARVLAGAPHARLGSLLERCDLVKFAARAPSADELERLLDDAESFVEETRGP